MKEYRVDFTEAKTLWELHEALKIGLNLFNGYGMNMDALWDCLTGGDIIYPATIYLIGLKSIPKDLNRKVVVMLKIFDDLIDRYHDGRFTIKIVD